MKLDLRVEDGAEESDEEIVLPVFKLAEEDVEFIYDNTHYTLKDIKEWHRSATTYSDLTVQRWQPQIFFRGFAKDCPNGKLYRQKVTEVYEEIVPNGNCKFFVDQIFRIFDQDCNGYLDFKVKF